MEKKVKVKYYEYPYFMGYDENNNRYEKNERYGIVICPFCGYECDGILWNNSLYPSLMDDVCLHLRRVEGGYGFFSDKERPEINPFERR